MQKRRFPPAAILESLSLAGGVLAVLLAAVGFDDRGKVRLSVKAINQETGKEISGDAKEES